MCLKLGQRRISIHTLIVINFIFDVQCVNFCCSCCACCPSVKMVIEVLDLCLIGSSETVLKTL